MESTRPIPQKYIQDKNRIVYDQNDNFLWPFYAVETNDLDLLKETLKDGSGCGTFSKMGYTILHHAAFVMCEKHEIIDYLLETCKDLIDTQAHDLMNYTPLLFAARYGNDIMVKKLLEKNANTRITDYQGKTALELAQEIENKTDARMRCIQILKQIYPGNVYELIHFSLLLL